MVRKAEILNELREISTPVAELGSLMPYQTPEGYFENLSDQILQRIYLENLSVKEELETISPLLAGLEKKTLYHAPGGYFDTLSIPARLPAAHQAAQGKLVKLSSVKRIGRYIAAAVIAGILFAGSWFILEKQDQQPNVVAKNPKNTTETDISENVKELSESEMTAFIETGISSPTLYASEPSYELKEEDIRLLLADVADHDLQLYLEKTVSSNNSIN